MGYFKSAEINTGEGFIYVYSGISQSELEKLIDAAMSDFEYKHLGHGIYEKGSRTKRILFGGFCKYYKFQLSVDATDPNNIKVRVLNGSSGMSGGAIGVAKVRNEIERLRQIYQSL
jgi:hypothetical protein